jgi:outer membrane immunogenic protein
MLPRLSAVFIGGLTAVAFTQIASAADLPRKAPVYVPPFTPAFSWSGFYVGINGGYGWGKHDVSFNPGSPDADSYFIGGAVPGAVGTSPTGGLIGGQIGYNWQWAPNWVSGVEADLDWADISGSGSVATTALGFAPFTTSAEQKLKAFGTLRGRIGYAFDRVLVYGAGGLAYGDTELNTSVITPTIACSPIGQCAASSSSEWRAGWTAGAGVEWAFAPSWSIKGEWLYYDLGSRSQNQFDPNSPNIVYTSSADYRGNIIRAGINYKF